MTIDARAAAEGLSNLAKQYKSVLDAAEVLAEIGKLEGAIVEAKSQLHSVSRERDEAAVRLEAEKRELAATRAAHAELKLQSAKESERLTQIKAEISNALARIGLRSE